MSFRRKCLSILLTIALISSSLPVRLNTVYADEVDADFDPSGGI